ncbi:MAG: DMT family transporter [Alphaproteobacteria bacterium]|nr:MAG: DMT family transporter [Alphaproteobacteria bacterium]
MSAAPPALRPAAAVGSPTGVGCADPARGIALMILAAGLYAIMDALVKWLGPTYPTLQLVFIRSLFALVPLGLVLMREGTLAGLRTRHPFGHAARALLGIISLAAFFHAYASMPLADVVAISFAAPLFVTALSVPLLGERVGVRRWSAVVIGFVGVVVMVRPGPGMMQSAAWIALLGTVLYALVMISVRKLGRTETSTAIVFYYSLASIVVAGAFMPFQWVAPTGGDWALLIAMGLVGGIGQIAMTNAFRHADVAVVAPFDYTTMVWAVAIGYGVWGDVPALNVWLGMAVVMASGLYIVHREARLGLRRGIARRLQPRR